MRSLVAPTGGVNDTGEATSGDVAHPDVAIAIKFATRGSDLSTGFHKYDDV